MKVRKIEKVILYDEGAAEILDINELAEYLKQKLIATPVNTKGNPFTTCLEKVPEYARRLASIKIPNITSQITSGQEPLYGEVEYETRRILGRTKAFGVLYDGFYLQRVFSELIPREGHTLAFVHIFLTNRLFATWEEADKRYHARTSVYGFPSVISTTGLVEAPAKPREYYFLRRQYEMVGRDLLELKNRFKGSFLDYEDERLTEVTKGYVMQVVFYSLTGNPFCEDKGCRLYNAHWQEELIFAQLESPYEFCAHHSEILDSLRRE
jgi:hypothetical protein